MSRFAALLIFAASVGQSQTPQPSRKESVSVSAGLTKAQLATADEFDAKFAVARKAVRDNPKDAVKQLRALLDAIAANDFLNHNKPQVLNAIGQAYLASGQASDAIKIFEQRLAMEQDNCKAQASYPSGCAEVQSDLANARIAAGDFGTATDLAREAVENFRRQVKLEQPYETQELQHYVHLLKLGQSTFVYAALLARSGNGTEAKLALQQTIGSLTEIVSNTEVQPSIRADAQQLLDLAKKQATVLH